jgi:hypothetical protein
MENDKRNMKKSSLISIYLILLGRIQQEYMRTASISCMKEIRDACTILAKIPVKTRPLSRSAWAEKNGNTADSHPHPNQNVRVIRTQVTTLCKQQTSHT